MNLHGIVGPFVSAINPQVPVSVQVSTGSTKNTDGKRVPSYAAPITVLAQVQALSQADIQHADMLNIQGVRRAIYLNGEVDGLIRSQNKGGDLITLQDGSVWLVSEVTERWPDWVKVIVTLQNQ